ncbi:MAG: hypothetical protein IK127_03620 [Clostridia bacterium]|nr:hypothetical protein [Clostridia bacterium]
MKKLSILVLILVLLVSTALSEGIAATEHPQLEGNGYDTPEEAVLAYLDAMNNADVHGMLATFAHESYVEHLDTDLYIQRMNSIFPQGTANSTPITDAYSAELILFARYGSLASDLLRQYTTYTDDLDGMTRAPMNQEAIDEHNQYYEQSILQSIQGHVTFVEWVDAALLTSGTAISPVNRRNIAMQYGYVGADDLAELVVRFRINGADFLQCMTCAKYGGRWYNLLLHGNTASILGLTMNTVGLIPLYEAANKESFLLSAEALDSTLLAERDQYKASSLGGTHWQLVSLNQPDISLAASSEGALKNEADLWCELHFYSCGGATVMLTAGDALYTRFDLTYRTTLLGVAWSESDGKLHFDQYSLPSRFGYRFNTEIVSAVWGGNFITILFQDGTAAVFQRYD